MLSRGFSLIGLLLTMACIMVMSVFMLTALNKAMTGEGSALPGTVASFKDKQYLTAIYSSMAADSHFREGRFLVPQELVRGANRRGIGGRIGSGRTRNQDASESLNTTANLFSAMIAQSYTIPGQLLSGNEYNPVVWPDDDYDFTAYDPAGGIYWDPGFVADLDRESNTSFAHVPLYGKRLRRHWLFTAGYRTPILSNRGPRDGIDDLSSYTYGRSGRWGGHVVFGDGHVEFLETFTPPGLFFQRGSERVADNIFAAEQGPDGGDAILAFTKALKSDGPVLQFD